ncbi:hypothetical protein ACFRCI_17350 [Streptomyces sp. NPDC056638]|uniref:hypothetical protein n=1 Tax=Streptomyces sp. NPDC056638 TaxID=3345887 RepID=UPI00367755CA
MSDKLLKSAVWHLEYVTVKITLEESPLGVRIVNDRRYRAKDGEPMSGHPTWHNHGDYDNANTRYDTLLAELTAKHGEPDKREEG